MRGILVRVLVAVFAVSVGGLAASQTDAVAVAQPTPETFTINVSTEDGGPLPATLVVCGAGFASPEACTSAGAFGTGSSGTTTLEVPSFFVFVYSLQNHRAGAV